MLYLFLEEEINYNTMKRSIILLIILACSLHSNAQPCFSDKSERTKYNFKLLKKGVCVDTNKVRIDGVYIMEHIMQAPLSKKQYITTYTFTRFFPNGRVYSSWSYCSFPTNEELNELQYGTYGYYKVDSNRIIKETYSQPAGYYYIYYILDSLGGGYSVYSSRFRSFYKTKEIIDTSPNKLRFYFYQCKLEDVEAFW